MAKVIRAEAAGIAVASNEKTTEGAQIAGLIQAAMTEAHGKAVAAGITDPKEIRTRMLAARDKTRAAIAVEQRIAVKVRAELIAIVKEKITDVDAIKRRLAAVERKAKAAS